MKYIKYILLFILILFDSYIIYQSCLDAEASSQTSGTVTNIVVGIIDFIIPGNQSIIDIFGENAVHNFIRKSVGHFGLFFVLGTVSIYTFIVWIKRKRYIYIFHFIHGLLLAFITEFIQKFINGRAGSIKDVGIDYAGYITSSIIILLIYYFYCKRKEHKDVR